MQSLQGNEQAGIEELAEQATNLFDRIEKSLEGRNASRSKRSPDFSETGWLP